MSSAASKRSLTEMNNPGNTNETNQQSSQNNSRNEFKVCATESNPPPSKRRKLLHANTNGNANGNANGNDNNMNNNNNNFHTITNANAIDPCTIVASNNNHPKCQSE